MCERGRAAAGESGGATAGGRHSAVRGIGPHAFDPAVADGELRAGHRWRRRGSPDSCLGAACATHVDFIASRPFLRASGRDRHPHIDLHASGVGRRHSHLRDGARRSRDQSGPRVDAQGGRTRRGRRPGMGGRKSPRGCSGRPLAAAARVRRPARAIRPQSASLRPRVRSGAAIPDAHDVPRVQGAADRDALERNLGAHIVPAGRTRRRDRAGSATERSQVKRHRRRRRQSAAGQDVRRSHHGRPRLLRRAGHSHTGGTSGHGARR